MAEVIMGVDSASSKTPPPGKRKEKELTMGTPKRSRKKVGETSSAFLPSLVANAEFLKPEFSTCELGRQVTMTDLSKDLDTSMALA